MIYMEVGLGLRGPVEFMSKQWQKLVGHAISGGRPLGARRWPWDRARVGAARADRG